MKSVLKRLLAMLILCSLAMGGAIDGECSTLAAKSAKQLEFGFVKNLENPNYVIYKASHLEANPGLLRPGEYKLNLPNLGNAELNWAQNQQALQKAMNVGNPIRDLSPNYGGGFLQRERDFLSKGGWKFDSSSGYWNPPAH